jgi:hypothetical protein
MKSRSVCLLLWTAVTVGTLSGALPNAAGQNNAICATVTLCSQQQASPAFLDVSVVGVRKGDICQTIYDILLPSSYPATGAVIDARGLPAGTTSMVCATGTSPWFESSTGFVNKPSTILLPAGVITIPATWVLPAGTKLIGEGSQNPPNPIPNPLPEATVIQACTSSINGCNNTNFSGPMLQFGAPCPGSQCTGVVKGISVENVVLNGNGLSITGIQNGQGQELTSRSGTDRTCMRQVIRVMPGSAKIDS